MKLRNSSIFVLVLISLLIVGCSGNNSAGSGNGKETIEWWIPNWDEESAKELVEEFEKENPDIEVNISILTWETMENKIRVALETGEAPDLITELESRIQGYASKELLTNLDRYYEENLDKSDFVTSAIEINSFNDSIYGVPFRHDGSGVLYNKGMFEEAGLDPDSFPETWEEFMDVSKKLTKDTDGDGSIDQYGTAWPLGNQTNAVTRYLQLFYSHDGEILNDDETKSQFNTPAGIDSMEALVGTVFEEVVPKSTVEFDNDTLRDTFINERVAMYIGGPFDIEAIQSNNDHIELGTAVIPGPSGMGTTTVNGFSLIIPENNDNKDVTWKLIEFISQSENMAKLTDTFPATQSALDLPEFSDELLIPFQDQLENGKSEPSYQKWPEMEKIIYQNIQFVLQGDLTVEKATEQIDQEIEKILK